MKIYDITYAQIMFILPKTKVVQSFLIRHLPKKKEENKLKNLMKCKLRIIY